MKIGELDVPDSAIEAFLKSNGRRIVEENDYIAKSAAAADLVKFRAVTGETRSVEDIQKIIKAYEDAENKNKTQTELLMAETKRLSDALKAKEGEIKLAQLEVKKRDVKQYFEQAMEANKVKVIDPILEPFRKEFYEMDEAGLTPEILKAKVNEALLKASELQKGELARLGLNGITPEPTGQSFGAGFSSVTVTPRAGFQATSETDLFDIMRQTSATPLGVPIGKPTPKQ